MNRRQLEEGGLVVVGPDLVAGDPLYMRPGFTSGLTLILRRSRPHDSTAASTVIV